MSKFKYAAPLFLSLTATQTFAASITKIDAQKKLVSINEGSSTQFVKKAKVCFYDLNLTKLGCSFISGSKDKTAIIKIKGKKLFGKLTVGTTVQLDNGSPGAIAETDANKANEGDSRRSYLSPFLTLPIRSPISFQNLFYEPPLGAEKVSSMWSPDSVAQSVGIGAEFGLGLGLGQFQLVFGLRKRIFKADIIAADYKDENKDQTYEQYADTLGKATSVGFYSDAYYLISDFGVVDIRFGGGLDFDSSKVAFSSVQKSDADVNLANTLYSGQSTLKAVGLRLIPTIDLVFGRINFSLASLIYVPLYQKSTFKLDTMTDDLTTASLDPATTPEIDVKESLLHKAQFGTELMLTAGFLF